MENKYFDYKIIKAEDMKDWEERAKDILEQSIILDYSEIKRLSEEDEGTFEQWIKVYLKDPNYIYLIFYKDEFIGYMHNVIFSKETGREMLSGKMKDSDINENNIVFPYEPGHYDMYCVCVCIKTEHQNKGLGKLMFDELMLDIEKLKVNKIYIDSIITDVYSELGLRYFNKHGFVITNVNVNHGKIAIRKL